MPTQPPRFNSRGGKGRIPAGRYIRIQCQRFLDELKEQRRKAFPFRFDVEKAARVCRFIERLPHTKGKWAAGRERIVLQPWQVFAIGVPFGWVHKEGMREGPPAPWHGIPPER